MTPIYEEAEKKITLLARLNQTQFTLLFIIFDCNSQYLDKLPLAPIKLLKALYLRQL